MHLSELMNLDDLEEAIRTGLVMVSEHSEFGYKIHHYTRKCMYGRHWSPVTLQCRGLIVAADGTVIARPFQKFWTYGQARLPKTVDKPGIITEKLDGSCGVLYATPTGEYRVSTTKKFDSPQAIWATAWWKENCPDVIPPANCTVQFEMIYPGNRIVTNYGEKY